jgi:hypothetical protein
MKALIQGLREGGGGLLDRDDNLEVGARLLGRRCKDLVGGGLIAEPNTPSFSITPARQQSKSPAFAGLSLERTTGIEPATLSLGS